jgi:hypothetical protein
MNISKQEAQDSLNEIQSAVEQTRRAIAHGVASSLLILWGVIWVIGYSGTQFFPAKGGLMWMPLVFIGAISSWIFGARHRSSVHSANSARIGIFWLVLFAYAGIWLTLLHSTKLPSGVEWANYQPTNDRQIGAFFATVPMFAYVVGGLWLDRFFVWLGGIVTVLTLIGFFALPAWFNLWMAFTGGGSLILAGFFIRKHWK